MTDVHGDQVDASTFAWRTITPKKTRRHRTLPIRTMLAFVLGVVAGWLCCWLINWRGHSAAPTSRQLGDMAAAGTGLAVTDYDGDAQLGRLEAASFVADGTCAWLERTRLSTPETRGLELQAVTASRAVHHMRLQKTFFAGQVKLSGSVVGAADVLVLGPRGTILARAQPAVMRRGTFELKGDLITYDPATGELRAQRGTQGLLAGQATPFGRDCIANVRGREAVFQEATEAWTFAGDAVAWCGDDRLQADVIRGNPETLQAGGGIRLLVHGADGEIVTVNADRLVGADQSSASFAGGVQVSGPAGTMACDTLDITMVGGEVESIDCRGERVTVEGSRGNVSGASRCWHHVAGGVMEARGNPARIDREDGSWAAAPLLRLDLETGAIFAGPGPTQPENEV